MSATLKDALVEALNDEYKAHAMYRHVINKFGEIRPFINIVAAEQRHIRALLPLFEKYDIPVPEDDWASRIEAPASIREACQVAVEAEIENGEMYDRLLGFACDYPDVQDVFKKLQSASLENHLPAFQRCVERGESAGKGKGKGRGNGKNRHCHGC